MAHIIGEQPRCPKCKKFLYQGQKSTWAKHPSGKGKIMISLYFESCACGYRYLEKYDDAVKAHGYEPLPQDEHGRLILP